MALFSYLKSLFFDPKFEKICASVIVEAISLSDKNNMPTVRTDAILICLLSRNDTSVSVILQKAELTKEHLLTCLEEGFPVLNKTSEPVPVMLSDESRRVLRKAKAKAKQYAKKRIGLALYFAAIVDDENSSAMSCLRRSNINVIALQQATSSVLSNP